MRRILTYSGFVLMWVIVLAIILWADTLAAEHHKQEHVTGVNITIEKEGRHSLIDAEMITSWIKERQLYPEGIAISDIDIAAIERAIVEHSAVAEAMVYVTYGGKVEIEIIPREPIGRLRIAGYDSYISDDGYIIRATECRAAAVPVITGRYKPLFDASYRGCAEERVRDTIASLDIMIEELEDVKLPYFAQMVEERRALRKITSERIKRGLFMSEMEHELIVTALKQRKSDARATYNQKMRNLNDEVTRLDMEQDDIRQRKEVVRQAAADFRTLIGMLKQINSSSFWSSEIVQIVASGGENEPLQIAIVPRSGRFTVDLGTTERIEEKLSTLYAFYHQGLDMVGWSKYKEISLRYDGQVVCR